jgi:hypothetical protein
LVGEIGLGVDQGLHSFRQAILLLYAEDFHGICARRMESGEANECSSHYAGLLTPFTDYLLPDCGTYITSGNF